MPAGVRQQKGGRRAAPPAPAPAPRKLAPGEPAAGGAAAAGTPRGRGGQALTAASGPDLPCRAAIVRRPRGNPSPRAAPLPRYLLGGARSASKFPGIGLKIPAPAARRGPAGLRSPGPRAPGPPAPARPPAPRGVSSLCPPSSRLLGKFTRSGLRRRGACGRAPRRGPGEAAAGALAERPGRAARGGQRPAAAGGAAPTSNGGEALPAAWRCRPASCLPGRPGEWAAGPAGPARVSSAESIYAHRRLARFQLSPRVCPEISAPAESAQRRREAARPDSVTTSSFILPG